MQSGAQTQMTPEQAIALAARLYDTGKLTEAETLCRRIIAAQPGFHPAYFRLGLIASRVGKLKLAAELVTEAINLDASVPPYHRTLIDIYRHLRQYNAAIEVGNRAIKLAPQDADAHYLLGLTLADSGKLDYAMMHYRLALKANPRHDQAANNLGAALEKTGNDAEAEEFYAKAVEFNPRNAEAQNNLGALLSARSDLALARRSFIASIEANPSFVHAHYNLSALKKYTADDPHLAALETLAQKAHELPADVRLRLWFALGKAWEDVGRYDDSFAAYSRGNKLKRATIQYDEAGVRNNINDLVHRFDLFAAMPEADEGSKDETPIFIVGMPRSGTTLIEQILSSHSGVYGAGELKDFSDAVTETWKIPTGVSYVDALLDAGPDDLAEIGERYIEKIRKLNGSALRICDKMPGNFFYTGLIRRVFPNAKIIHSQRDPMDTCFSNYSRLFNETMPFAYDLTELGHYYQKYDRLMRHWKDVMLTNSVLEMRYEDVVADLETQARRLVEYCGLPWEDSCLEFYKNERPVKTASVAQVRQPIYKSSVARWEHFRRHLGPLQAAIEDETA